MLSFMLMLLSRFSQKLSGQQPETAPATSTYEHINETC